MKIHFQRLLLSGLASLCLCGSLESQGGEVQAVPSPLNSRESQDDRSSTNAIAAQRSPGNAVGGPEMPPHIHVLPTNAIAQAVREGFSEIGFERLSGFEVKTVVESTGLKLTNAIPGEVKALDGKRVVIAGFVRPLTMHEGLTTSFLLLKSEPQCCMGGPPQINEWVIVRMTGGGVRSLPEKPVAVCGKLSVGEYREDGRLRAIYVMDGESVRGPDPE